MDVREKLVELLQDGNNPVWGWFPNNVTMVQLADYLIANGITVQEWIPVAERLPDENNRLVLCLCVSGAMEVLKFDYTMWNWDAQYPGRCYMENYVTHWMPLPKPPKEA